MRLKRLRIEQFRQFRQPLEICDFESGINLFTGPNESGKSSIVRAIRAAFFERHRSSSVDDLCPWDDSSATPTVELDFDVGGEAYYLIKSFLRRKRCELKIGALRLESTEAEDRLAELLGFQFATKGASKPEHWGIPGLLWIEQGTCQQVHGAVGYATDHLRSALNESLGEVASSSGDEVLDRVRAERAELLTSTGKPTRSLSTAVADLAEARTRKAAIERQVAAHRQQVDTLGSLRQQQAIVEAERPWEGFRAQLKLAEERQARVQKLSEKLIQDRTQLAQYDKELTLVRDRLADFDKRTQEFVIRETALTRATETVGHAAAAHAHCVTKQKAANEAYLRAKEALQLARQEDRRAMLTRSIRDTEPNLRALAAAIKASQAAQTALANSRKLALASEIDKGDLIVLHKQHKDLRELEIRQAAVATRLTFVLEPGKSLTLNGEAISDQDERMLVAAGELGIAGVGCVRITPGGTDLALLERKKTELQEAHDARLKRVGVASVEEAEQRGVQYQQQLDEIRHAEQALAVHAPKGLEALLIEQEAIRARAVEGQGLLAQLPDAPAVQALSEKQADADQDNAHKALETTSREAGELNQALATAEADCDNARRERDALHHVLQDPTQKKRQQDAELRLIETKAERNALTEAIDVLVQQIAEAHPEILVQDVDRFRRSAEQAEKQWKTQGEDIIRLQAQLESVGAQGLEEQDAALDVEVGQRARRYADLARRAAALDLLHDLLEGKRRELIRCLQAPLQKHLNHYLRLLFPGASLEIDENLTPGPLTRQGLRGQESGEFEALSFGAREQMGVISRLAYADLLQAAGRPTLIILDDSLVHSDEHRLAQMKRILFDAAQRHQILLFSCHPGAWRDLGVAPRQIDSFRVTV